jgi:apolipoprotein N-acyltransferase
VSNNGITGLVDPYGRVIQHSQPFVRNITYMDVPKEKRNNTIYMYIYHYLYLFILLLFGVFLIVSFVIK